MSTSRGARGPLARIPGVQLSLISLQHRSLRAVQTSQQRPALCTASSSKRGSLIYCCATCVCFFAGFVQGWQLTLLICAFVPVVTIVAACTKQWVSRLEKIVDDAYAAAGAAASQALLAIRTVTAFGMQEREVERYSGNLHTVEKAACRRGAAMGVMTGSLWVSILSAFGLGLWFGGWLIRQDRENNPECRFIPGDGCFTGGSVMQVCGTAPLV